MSFTLRPIAATCALFTCAAACAQTTPAAQLDPVVVTATRIETPLSETLSSVNVMTRDEIASSQAASLADLLSGQTGFEFGRNGGPGTVTSFFMRGLNSTNVVVMVDGLRAPIDGIGALAAIDLPLDSIERVEILRGNVSALYGDAANGGVIQIFTRAQTSGLSIGTMLGSRGAKAIHARYGAKINETMVSVSLSDEQSARASSMNPEVKAGASSDTDTTATQSFSLSLQHPVDRANTISASLNQTQTDVNYDHDNFTFGLESDRHLMQRVSDNIQVNWLSHVSERWASDLSFGNQQQRIEDRKNGVLRTSNWDLGRASSEQSTLRWSNTLTVKEDLLLNAGGEVSAEQYQSDAILSGYDSQRDTQALFFGLTQYAKKASFQMNWRFDHIDLEDMKKSAQRSWARHSIALGAGYEFAPNWKLTGHLATGFRVPTSYDIALDKFIRMERHLNREASVQYHDGITQLRATAFWSTFGGLIINHPEIYEQTNTDAKNHGIEFEARHQLGNNRLRLNLVVQDPVNLSINRQLARRAKTYGSVGLDHVWSDMTVGATLHASDKRYDSNFSDTVMGGYTTLDLTASKALTPEWTLRGKLENVTDERYELASGYNTPRRGVFVTLEYRAK